MKKAKAKTVKRQQTRAISKSTDRQRPYEKAAIRSQAFAKAIFDAKIYATDPQRLRALFEEASRKAAAIPKKPFKDSWPYLQSMLRLIRAYFRGFFDDATVIGFAITRTRQALDDFMIWETAAC